MHYIIKCNGNRDLFEVIHKRLQDLGIRPEYGITSKDLACKNCFSINSDRRIYHYVFLSTYYDAKKDGGTKRIAGTDFTILSLEDLFGDLLKKKKKVSVVLNEKYTAEVTNNEVKVGCQSFPVGKIAELSEALNQCRRF